MTTPFQPGRTVRRYLILLEIAGLLTLDVLQEYAAAFVRGLVKAKAARKDHMSRWIDEELTQRLGVTVWVDEDCPPDTAYLIPIDPTVLALYRNEAPGETPSIPDR